MATYGGYRIILSRVDGAWEDAASELERKVNDLMMEGWEPYFGLTVLSGDSCLAQVMLWSESEED